MGNLELMSMDAKVNVHKGISVHQVQRIQAQNINVAAAASFAPLEQATPAQFGQEFLAGHLIPTPKYVFRRYLALTDIFALPISQA